MTKFLQIVLLFIAVLWYEANGTPLFQGISFQRGFEINFKPLPRKPIAFIKEIWSPFGVFGRKHAIQRRSSDSVVVPVTQIVPVTPVVVPRPAAPVFEHVEELEPVPTNTLRILPPHPPKSVPIDIPGPPPIISPISSPVISPAHSPVPLNIVITPAPKSTVSYNVPMSSIRPMMSVVTPAPFSNIVNIPPLKPPTKEVSSNMVIPPRSIASPHGLFTDISRAEPVREFIVSSDQPVSPPLSVEEKVPPLAINNIKQEIPPNDIVINDNSLIRGSKLALYFGNIFLQLMSQFLTNARATFDQISSPPPIYNS